MPGCGCGHHGPSRDGGGRPGGGRARRGEDFGDAGALDRGGYGSRAVVTGAGTRTALPYSAAGRGADSEGSVDRGAGGCASAVDERKGPQRVLRPLREDRAAPPDQRPRAMIPSWISIYVVVPAMNWLRFDPGFA